MTVENNSIRNSDRGVQVNGGSAANVTIRNNDLFGHTVGIELTSLNSTGHLIQGNMVHDNATYGISVQVGSAGGVQIPSNDVYGQTGTGDYGILLNISRGAVVNAVDNLVHDNYRGVRMLGTGPILQRNYVYANSSAGVEITSGSPQILSNQIYSNAVGILAIGSAASSVIRGNVLYSNTNLAVDVQIGSSIVIGNTIVQPVGTAVRYTATGTGQFKNNIVHVDVGTLLSVAASVQAAFVSDYNVLYPTSAAANVGIWGSTTAPTLSNWQTTSGRDAIKTWMERTLTRSRPLWLPERT